MFIAGIDAVHQLFVLLAAGDDTSPAVPAIVSVLISLRERAVVLDEAQITCCHSRYALVRFLSLSIVKWFGIADIAAFELLEAVATVEAAVHAACSGSRQSDGEDRCQHQAGFHLVGL